MKVGIEVHDVRDAREAGLIEQALADPLIRAFVLVCGALQELPSDQARRRVMTYVTDRLSEDAAVKREESRR